ncbi:AraC family transcriptional regulator [Pantoea sp. B65]|uniref:AraC family transcriptional regulator n=1 Tax=Pantoea sp. B65 TaxID=2813359 RepID=UPI0039B4652B
MDPLSDLLSLLKPRSYVSGGVALSRQMAIQWPQHEGIKCYAVVSGQCWLSVEGIADPLLLSAGDCYLLPPGPPFCLTTDLSATPVDFAVLRAGKGVATAPAAGDNEGCFLVGGHFILSGHHADLLLGSLPAIMHIRQESDRAAMRWSLERMAEEVRHPQPGSSLIARQLASMMLVQALRLHLTNGANRGVGWLFALADKQLSRALACIHDDPGHKWTLQKLAQRSGMSRSRFALRFRETVGSSPIEYLTRWRMLLACDRLKNSRESMPRIANSLGYESESAFGKAFKRITGCSPGQYSRQPRA